MNETKLFDGITKDVNCVEKLRQMEPRQSFGDWEARAVNEPKKFINDDLSIRASDLKCFRGKQIFVQDRPVGC